MTSDRTLLPLVEIWTDGGCRPNPGPGGWGAVLRFGEIEKELSGAEADTTNNRMELTAALSALQALKRPCRVTLHTDSQYLKNGMTLWRTGWEKKKWKNSAGDPVANQDLWQKLFSLTGQHSISWKWVKGHAGHPLNERADILATSAREAAFPQNRPPQPED